MLRVIYIKWVWWVWCGEWWLWWFVVVEVVVEVDVGVKNVAVIRKRERDRYKRRDRYNKIENT